MIIFIDFDDVLFNTKKFKDDLQNLFFQRGISRDIFDKYYNSDLLIGVKTYDPWNHLEMIKNGEKIDIEEAKKDLGDFMIDTHPYLFEDSLKFLQDFKDEFICIVSYGESHFQEMKIGECGIGKYCNKIKITNELKSGAIENILNEYYQGKENVFFIEDRTKQLEDVKNSFPFVKTIFMRRSEGRYKDNPTKHCDFKASNLKEASDIINSLK